MSSDVKLVLAIIAGLAIGAPTAHSDTLGGRPSLARKDFWPERSGRPLETGPVSWQTPLQRQQALLLAERSKPLVQAEMASSTEVRLLGLRTGVLERRRVLCGTALSDRVRTRFISNGAVATLESTVPAASFQAAWKAIGCS